MKFLKLNFYKAALAFLFIGSGGHAYAAPDFTELLQAAFPGVKQEGRNGPRTDSLLIFRDGKLLIEKYDRGYDENKKHVLWSTSKSITSLLFAIASHKGLVKKEDSICRHDQTIPQSHCQIRYQDLLQWTSGLKWVEEYEKGKKLRQASVLAMFYGEGVFNMKNFVLKHSFIAPPGTAWRYSSGDTQLLAALLPGIFGASDINEVFRKELFQPLGITNWTVEQDNAGNALGASNIYLASPDLLKIGQLVMNKGRWNGNQIFAPEWMDFIYEVPKAFATKRLDHKTKHVGGGSFWLNRPGAADFPAPWPTAPDDTLMTMGHWGQYMMIVPSMQLIVIRTGDTRDGSFKADQMAELVMKGFGK